MTLSQIHDQPGEVGGLQADCYHICPLSAHVTPPQNKDLLGVLVTQLMIDLLCAIFQCMDDLKSSSANKVLCMWLAHYTQFDSVQTLLSDLDREVLQIWDPKSVQALLGPNADRLPAKREGHTYRSEGQGPPRPDRH